MAAVLADGAEYKSSAKELYGASSNVTLNTTNQTASVPATASEEVGMLLRAGTLTAYDYHSLVIPVIAFNDDIGSGNTEDNIRLGPRLTIRRQYVSATTFNLGFYYTEGPESAFGSTAFTVGTNYAIRIDRAPGPEFVMYVDGSEEVSIDTSGWSFNDDYIYPTELRLICDQGNGGAIWTTPLLIKYDSQVDRPAYESGVDADAIFPNTNTGMTYTDFDDEGSPDFADVDDWASGASDGDTTYNRGDMTNQGDVQWQSYPMTSTGVSDPLALMGVMRVRGGVVSKEISARNLLTDGTDDALGGAKSLTDTSYVIVVDVFSTQPDGSAWDATAVNAIEAGIKAELATGSGADICFLTAVMAGVFEWGDDPGTDPVAAGYVGPLTLL